MDSKESIFGALEKFIKRICDVLESIYGNEFVFEFFGKFL